MKEIQPSEIQLGNFISCAGKTEMVTGITPRPDGSFFIHHSSSNQQDNPFGHGVEYSAYPIPLTDEWKEALKIDKYQFPGWIKYVHEAQNFIRWYVGVDLLPEINWSLVPTTQEDFF